MKEYESIIARYEADPQAWQAHVDGGDIAPTRLQSARLVAEFWAEFAQTKNMTTARKIISLRHGYKNPETVRNYVRRLSGTA
jgi:hypothetical protein